MNASFGWTPAPPPPKPPHELWQPFVAFWASYAVTRARARISLRPAVVLEVAVAAAGAWHVSASGVASSAVTAFMVA